MLFTLTLEWISSVKSIAVTSVCESAGYTFNVKQYFFTVKCRTFDLKIFGAIASSKFFVRYTQTADKITTKLVEAEIPSHDEHKKQAKIPPKTIS